MTAEGAITADLGMLALAAVGHAGSGPLAVSGWSADMLQPCIAALRAAPGERDRRLVALAAALDLSDAEIAAAALCLAVERDSRTARALAEVQHPLGTSRPLLGLVATALEPVGGEVLALASGAAVASGLIEIGSEAAALPERSLSIPLPLLGALTGHADAWANVRPVTPPRVPLPDAMRAAAAARAGLLAHRPRGGMVIRSASASEALAAAILAASALGLQLARIDGDPPPGLAAWLLASGHAPLFAPRPGPGERWPLPALGHYAGPWFVLPGLDGVIEAEEPPVEWVLAMPDEEARAGLWREAGAAQADAATAAASFRQGAGRIAEAARRAHDHARIDGREALAWQDIIAGVAAGAASLDMLARRSDARVPDGSLVLPPELDDALARLVTRAQLRSTLSRGLGTAVSARYRPGVRALFTGESGTGKTLAAHWLAGKLGLPLYRVDMSALTSKWIGETEKNLSAILGAAEHADVLLFFDEADSLFGARTDVSDAHDRYANAQTNFLLQRIEEFDGIALLASNSRDRFDPAFARRLDVILEFPMPEAPARRDLWRAHLGDAHVLDDAALDRIAIAVDLAGGHIRNIVLAAAARARAAGTAIGWEAVAAATCEEYGKLGRPPPHLSR